MSTKPLTFVSVHIGNRRMGVDDIPGLGSGMRVFFITSVDKKYTHLRDPASGDVGKVLTSVWNSMSPQTVNYRKQFVSGWWKKSAPVAWTKMREAAA